MTELLMIQEAEGLSVVKNLLEEGKVSRKDALDYYFDLCTFRNRLDVFAGIEEEETKMVSLLESLYDFSDEDIIPF